jgi:hypothetical protein
MNGIKMSDCKFYVDKEARLVVCVIPNTQGMLRDFIEDHFRWSDLDFDFALSFKFSNNALRMPYSFSGKAVCAEEDEWDEELGKMIAFSRAKDKCYKSFFKRANRFVQTVDARLGDMINLFNGFGLKLDNKREALQNQIDERINSNSIRE